MNVEILADEQTVANQAAKFIAAEASAAVQARGRFVVAFSGGRTPWVMLRALSAESVPWEAVHLIQVDERVAPDGHADRNFTHLQESLLTRVPLRPEQIHAMPVTALDLNVSAREYAAVLQGIAGTPPVLDLIHLGLGADGHTASLVPEDPVLNVMDKDVAITEIYQGRRRMTLTYPIINRARRILWVVTGSEKADPFARLLKGDHSIPAGRVRQDQDVVLVDRAATNSPPATA